jgi:hypothetical protein
MHFICVIIFVFFHSLFSTSQQIPFPNGNYLRLASVQFPDLLIPLKNINVNCTIHDNIARVTIEQEYINDFTFNIETEYFFAISSEAIFDSMEIEIGERILRGELIERKSEDLKFELMLNEGQTALYAQLQSKDIMQINIGNLLSKEKIIVRYSYMEELSVAMNQFLRLVIYSTLSPLYSDGENVPISEVIPNANTYKWMIRTEIYSSKPIKYLEVPSHKENVIITKSDDLLYAEITLDPMLKYDPNKNYEINYIYENPHEPQIYLDQFQSTIGTLSAAYLSFFPQLNNLSLDQAVSDYKTNKKEIFYSVSEFIFVVDRSGSMAGFKLEQLKKALTLILEILPNDCYFNVLSFGTKSKFMFQNSVTVAQGKEEAIKEISLFTADMKGTELAKALEAACNMEYILTCPRIIFILTDAALYRYIDILEVLGKCRQDVKVNTIGIGSIVSNDFIKKVAKYGNGVYEFINDDNLMSEKIVSFIQNSLSPFVESIEIKIPPQSQENILVTIPALESIPSFITKNQLFSFFIAFKKDVSLNQMRTLNLTLSYYDSISIIYKKYDLKTEDSELRREGIYVKLAIKRLIDEDIFLMESNNFVKIPYITLKHEIIDLSLKFHVLCERTLFRINFDSAKTITAPLVKVVIPNIIPKDYIEEAPRAEGIGLSYL